MRREDSVLCTRDDHVMERVSTRAPALSLLAEARLTTHEELDACGTRERCAMINSITVNLVSGFLKFTLFGIFIILSFASLIPLVRRHGTAFAADRNPLSSNPVRCTMCDDGRSRGGGSGNPRWSMRTCSSCSPSASYVLFLQVLSLRYVH